MAAQSRRKKWGTRDNIFYKSKSGKITNMSNYNAKQFHTAYSKILGGKSGGSSGGGGGGSSSNRTTQMLRRVSNNAVGQYQRARADKQASLANMSKNELLKLLSQTLQRQSKGGH
mgnify:CR=1 FL=1